MRISMLYKAYWKAPSLSTSFGKKNIFSFGGGCILRLKPGGPGYITKLDGTCWSDPSCSKKCCNKGSIKCYLSNRIWSTNIPFFSNRLWNPDVMQLLQPMDNGIWNSDMMQPFQTNRLWNLDPFQINRQWNPTHAIYQQTMEARW